MGRDILWAWREKDEEASKFKPKLTLSKTRRGISLVQISLVNSEIRMEKSNQSKRKELP